MALGYYQKRAAEASELFGCEFVAESDKAVCEFKGVGSVTISGGDQVPLECDVVEGKETVAHAENMVSVSGIYGVVGEKVAALVAKAQNAAAKAKQPRAKKAKENDTNG